MKRTLKMAVLAALTFGAQAASSQEQITVAQAVTTAEDRQVSLSQAQAPRKASMLEELGLAGHGPFPSRGGPIDE